MGLNGFFLNELLVLNINYIDVGRDVTFHDFQTLRIAFKSIYSYFLFNLMKII